MLVYLHASIKLLIMYKPLITYHSLYTQYLRKSNTSVSQRRKNLDESQLLKADAQQQRREYRVQYQRTTCKEVGKLQINK